MPLTLPGCVRISVLLTVVVVVMLPMKPNSGAAAEVAHVIAAVGTPFPPYYETSSARPTGFAIDALERVAASAGIKVIYLPLATWEEAQTAVASGRADVIPLLGITEPRKRDLAFTRPLTTDLVSAFALSSETGIHGLADLAGRRVATVEFDIGRILMNTQAGIIPVFFEDLGTAIRALAARQVAALVHSEPVVWRTARGMRAEHRTLRVIGPPLAEIERAIAVRNDLPELRRKLDQAAAEVVETTGLDALYRRWLEAPDERWTIETLAAMFSAGLVAAFLVIGSWRLRAILRYGRSLENPSVDGTGPNIDARDRMVVLALGMVVVTTVCVGATLGIVYQFTVEDEVEEIGNAVDDNARLIEAIARGAYREHSASPGAAWATTVSRLRDGLHHFSTIGEIRIARRNRDGIEFVLRQRGRERLAPEPIRPGSRIDPPMHRALSGERGVMSTTDYRDVAVLAAYAPVGILDLGVVMTQDASDFQTPFVRAGTIIAGVAAGVIAIAVFAFFRLGSPLLERISESQTRLQLSLEAARAGTWLWNVRAGTIHWDARMERIFGYAPGSFPGTYEGWKDRVHPEDIAAIETAVRAAFAKGGHLESEYRIRGPDGTWRFVDARAEVIQGDDGLPARMVGFAIDVTRRRADEEELRRYQSDLEGMVARQTAELRRNHALLECISAVQSMFIGRHSSEVLFDALLTDLLRLTESRYGFIAELRKDADGRPFQQTLAISNIAWDEETRRFYDQHAPTEFRFYAFDGLHASAVTTRAAVIANRPASDPRSSGRLPKGHPPLESFLGLPLMRGSEVIGSVGLANRAGGYSPDLARFLEPVLTAAAQVVEGYRGHRERSEAERQLLEKNADLERFHAEMQQFAYIVSHDLRSPLASINGFAKELRGSIQRLGARIRQLAPTLPPDAKTEMNGELDAVIPEALEFIEASAVKMDHLIKAILKLSRLGRQELRLEALDVRDIVETTIKALAFPISAAGADVVVEELPVVTSDRLAMEQIFANLLDNAVKYLDPGRKGRIVIAAKVRRRDTLFRVEDNGRGIAPEDIPRAFRIFQRVGERTIEGEGMGLAYVSTMVQRLGGRIWCESEPGRGSTFSFTIPARESAKASGSSNDEIKPTA